jgi:hypothetical protein
MTAQAAIENFKLVSVTPPAAIIDNASATTAEVDTKGWDYARYVVYVGATDIAMAALYLTESDATGSGHAEIASTDFSDSTQTDIDGNALALPAADDDNGFIVIDVDLRKGGRKRFLDLVLTAGDGSAGTYVAAWCELFRGDTLPTTVAGHGCKDMVAI